MISIEKLAEVAFDANAALHGLPNRWSTVSQKTHDDWIVLVKEILVHPSAAELPGVADRGERPMLNRAGDDLADAIVAALRPFLTTPEDLS